jgi:DedD protein
MREGAKQRLVGVAVVVALAVIFVPMLFEDDSPDTGPSDELTIPEAPPFEPDLKSERFLTPEDSGVGGFDPSGETESRPLALPPPGDMDADSVAGIPDEGTNESGSGTDEPEVEPPQHRASEANVEPPATPAGAPLIEPPPPRGAKDGMPSWVIQVASLRTPEAAGEMESKLRKAGYSAFVEQAEVRGKLYYRVRVGPEVDRANAERTAARLRNQQKLDTLIQNYP